MSKVVEEYCDLCGCYLYHSVRSFTVKGRERWWWHGRAEQRSDMEICGDCRWTLEYLMQNRRELVRKRIVAQKGMSPREQMDNKPKPISKSLIVRLFS